MPEGAYRRDRTSAVDPIVHDIRGQILSRRLHRGARLPSERELAARYEVSPPTVREALRSLAATNLVEARHGTGTFVIADADMLLSSALAAVVQLEDVSLASVLELSEGFYLHAVRLGMTAATDTDLAMLRAAAETFRNDFDPEAYAAALRDYLVALASCSHNRLLIILARFTIDAHITLAREVSAGNPGLWRRIADQLTAERIAIAAALESRDQTLGRAAVTAYMQRAHALVTEHVSGSLSASP